MHADRLPHRAGQPKKQLRPIFACRPVACAAPAQQLTERFPARLKPLTGGNTLRKTSIAILIVFSFMLLTSSVALALFGSTFQLLEPQNGHVQIDLKKISDGQAHYFKVRAEDGTMVSFFTLKSNDGVVRAAIDACDVCYRAGKGYVQSGDFMVCENCGQKFPSSRINVVKGGCNPAPLERAILGGYLVIKMSDVNANSWYCQFKRS
jgi:uncharacterized membrane protein